MRGSLIAPLVLAVIMAGCGSGTSSSSKPGPAGSECTTDQISNVTSCTKSISRTTFKGTWPFTVDSGTVECDQPQSVYFTAPDGTQYGINETALDHGAKPVDPIWRKDPIGVAPKAYIGDVIDLGLKMCGQ